MEELKKVFEFIKKGYQNPRTRSAVILGLYLIFFIFVFAMLRQADSNPSNTTEQIVNYSSINENYNYRYDVEIEHNDYISKYLFTGINNNENFTEKVELYNNDTKQYEEIFDYEDINPKFIDLETIISYVNNIKEEFTTNYKNGTIQKNYLVSLNKIDNNITSNEETIEINVYEKDNFITKIIIDGTNFDSKTNKNILKSKYMLEYSQINNEESPKE